MDKELISGLKRENFQAVIQGKETDLYTLTNSDGMVVNDSFRTVDPYDEPEFSGFELRVELNAVLDGAFVSFGSVVNELFYSFARYEDIDVINGENVLVPSGGDQHRHIAKYKAYPVPFRCTVHKPEFFELGQTVVFPDHENAFDNYRYGYAAHVPYIRSVITEMEWTFRGGTKLACGEGESLSMMTLAVESKADSVRREVRARTQKSDSDISALAARVTAIETALDGHSFWHGTQAQYDAMQSHDDGKWYGVYEESSP